MLRKILVVDDNIALAENLAEIIAEAELGEAVVAHDGEHALGLLRETQFDVMVTDMRMPGMSGAELIQRAHDLDPHLPVVVMTAFAIDEEIARAMNEGLLAVCHKPLVTKALLDFIASARRGRPVLVVDDDVSLADSLAEMLRRRGLSTATAHSLAEIDQLARPPAVALVDLCIRGEHNGASIQRVRKRFPDSSLILMTGFRRDMAMLPPLPIWEKPFDVTKLLDLVEMLAGNDREA